MYTLSRIFLIGSTPSLNLCWYEEYFHKYLFQNIDISMPNEVRIATINILQAAIRKHLEDISDWSFSISQRWDWKGIGSANLKRDWHCQFGKGLAVPIWKGIGSANLKRDWQCQFGTMRLYVFLSLLSVCIVSRPFCFFFFMPQFWNE